jgi:hypothetical protein
MHKLMGTIFFRTILILFLFLSCALTALATAQAPDKLIYSGQERKLFSNPLEAYYENSGTKRPNFMSRPFVISSGNWRGYVATWEIVDGKLFLLNVDSSLCEGAKVEADCKQVQLSNLFPKKVSDGKVIADWYSGELRVPDGEQIVYVNMGYGSVYERDLIFTVADGMVEGPKVIDNTKEQLPSEMDIALKELEKLKESPLGSQPAFSRQEKGQVSADNNDNDQHTGKDVIVPEHLVECGLKDADAELAGGTGLQFSFRIEKIINGNPPLFVQKRVFQLMKAVDRADLFDLVVTDRLVYQVFLPRLPVGRAQSAGLQSLKHAKRFIDRASDVQIVNDRILQHAFRIDDEQPAQGDVRFFDQDVVFLSELAAYVRRDRVFHAFDAVLVLRGLEPRAVRMDRVGRNAENLGADALEIIQPIRKIDQLGRANEREIERVEQKDQPFALVIRKLYVLRKRFHVLGRGHVEIRCRLADLGERNCIFGAGAVAVDMIYLSPCINVFTT